MWSPSRRECRPISPGRSNAAHWTVSKERPMNALALALRFQIGRGLAVLEASQLLVGADRQPELCDHRAGLDQLLLEGVDLGEGPLPVLGRAETLDPLDQDPAMPAAVVNGDVALARQRAPEAPQVRVGPL